MEIRVTQLQRRGTHVMFSVFIDGVQATRNREVYDRKNRRSTKIIAWEPTTEQVTHAHAHVDGYWDGKELKLAVEFSKWTNWPDAEKYRDRILRIVEESEHMERVLKTLRKLK